MRPLGRGQHRLRGRAAIGWLAAAIGICGGLVAAAAPGAFTVAVVLVVVLSVVLGDRVRR